MIFPVILCGGSGTRLWPLSRKTCPKQFVEFEKGKTLFKETIERLHDVLADISLSDILIIANESQKEYINKELLCLENQSYKIILEPCQKNTAGAICAAALSALRLDSEAMLLICPSDHKISNISEFSKSIQKAFTLANLGYIVTFGITPTSPETGYGYIKCGEQLINSGFKIDHFVEKPDSETANRYILNPNYLWNSGIFVGKAKNIIKEFEKFEPNILNLVNDCVNAFDFSPSNYIYQLEREIYSQVKDISIDYAIMSQTKMAAVVKSDFSWSDLGSWKSIYDNSTKDNSGNVVHGVVVSEGTNNCYLYSKDRLVAAVGLTDIAIIETKDAVLVSSLSKSQDVKKIPKLLEENSLEGLGSAVVLRPWGSYESLVKSNRFQVKRIIVKPGEQLSLQKHFHRAEHWIVVEGSAEIQIGCESHFVTENQSVYIPAGEVHRLTNPGRIPLVVIEVQSGAYLGEDDIVRLEDKYLRH